MKPKTNKWLQKTYEALNNQFFDGRLKLRPSKVRFASWDELDDDGMYLIGDSLLVNEDFKTHETMCVIVLLHEMVHVDQNQGGYVGYTDDSHDLIFHAGIDRLYRAGAYETLL
jgi:hypothetical protein